MYTIKSAYQLTDTTADSKFTITRYYEDEGEYGKLFSVNLNVGFETALGESGTLEYFKWASDSDGNLTLESATESTADLSVYNSAYVSNSKISSNSSISVFGGAVSNAVAGSSNYLEDIENDFVANSAIYDLDVLTTGASANGGAIANRLTVLASSYLYLSYDATISSITGHFIGNYVYSDLTATGGTISNTAYNNIAFTSGTGGDIQQL